MLVTVTTLLILNFLKPVELASERPLSGRLISEALMGWPGVIVPCALNFTGAAIGAILPIISVGGWLSLASVPAFLKECCLLTAGLGNEAIFMVWSLFSSPSYKSITVKRQMHAEQAKSKITTTYLELL